MLRINLLPPYVFDKQKKNRVWALWIALIVMTICIYVFANTVATALQVAADDEKARVQKLEAEKKGLDDKTAAVKSQIAETQTKQDFIASAQAWNDEWWKLYSVMRDVTSPKVILRRMYLGSPTVVNIVGWAPSEKEAADWWIQFRNKYTGPTGAFANVSFELPKNGWPPNADTTGAPGAPSAPSAGFSPRGPRGAAGIGGGGGGSFGGGASSPGGGSSDKDEDPGPGYLEDRLGIYFRVHVTLKTPFDNGKTVPIWGVPAADTTTAGGPAALPGGGPRRGPGGPPVAAPSGGASSASSDDPGADTGGSKRKSKASAGGEE